VENLSDEALGFGGLTLLTCPRASLAEPPRPFRMPDTTESAFEYGRLSGYSAAAG
jgi:hypothetical protein